MKILFRNISYLTIGICFIIQIFFVTDIHSQVELVPVSHPVYDFLKGMQLKGIIKEYNSSMIPISRGEVSTYLKKIGKSELLTKTEKKIVEDFNTEFEFDINGSLINSVSLLKKFDENSFFSNKKQKYIYNYVDTNASLFLNVFGELNSKSVKSDGGDKSVFMGDLGFAVRGTLYNRLGYSVSYTGGKSFRGNENDLLFAVKNDPLLKNSPVFTKGEHYFDFFNAHLRFITKDNWLSLTLGREAINCGFGYIDKMFLSNNTVPMDFLKLDLNYKKISYTFTYGSLKGDSIGMNLQSKNIAFHRLNVNFSETFKVGYFESVLVNDNPFSFVYFNPVSFITSADLNTGAKETTYNNTLMGFDLEINPVKNLSVQGTFLVDDINFSSVFKSDSSSFDNKFGYQIGTLWNEAFTIPNIALAVEYTRLNPFVYTHRFNVNSYTNWGLSLGHSLPPNSDEISIKINYNITNRLKLILLYQFQRSAGGIYFDSVRKQIINYGGNINRGDGDNLINSKFLLGDRINRTYISADIIFEPIKQYYFEFRYKYGFYDIIYLSKNQKESYFFANFKAIL